MGISKKIIENQEMSKWDGEGMQSISCAHVTSGAARLKWYSGKGIKATKLEIN